MHTSISSHLILGAARSLLTKKREPQSIEEQSSPGGAASKFSGLSQKFWHLKLALSMVKFKFLSAYFSEGKVYVIC